MSAAATTERAQFLAERLTGIGGSDAAAVLSVGYGCRRRLVLEKRGTAPDYPQEATLAMRRGTALEDLVAGEYAAQSARFVSSGIGVLKRHPRFEYLLVHVDGFISDGDRGLGVLEIKTMGREVFARFKRAGMQTDHIVQVQFALMVTELDWGSFAAFWPDGWQLIWFDVDRDEELIATLIEEGIKTWAAVQNGPLPERLDPKDRRCGRCPYRRSCQGEALLALAGSYTDQNSSNFVADPSLAPLVAEYRDAQQIVDEAEELLAEVRKPLEAAIGDRTAIETAGARIYFRPQVTKRYDTKELLKEIERLRQIFQRLAVVGGREAEAAAAAALVIDPPKARESVSRPLRVYPA